MMRDKHRILMLGAGDSSIRWAPFLDATKEEIEKIINAVERCVEELREKN